MQGKFDFDKYPHKAGHRGVRTSIKSADDINPQLRRLHKMIMIELESVFPEGLTGTELSQRLKRNILTIRPRTTEMKILGMIVDTDKTKKNDAGKPEIIYKLRGLDVIDYYGIQKDIKK
jgi:hypothetical protein